MTSYDYPIVESHLQLLFVCQFSMNRGSTFNSDSQYPGISVIIVSVSFVFLS
jgi:hypothetical protein